MNAPKGSPGERKVQQSNLLAIVRIRCGAFAATRPAAAGARPWATSGRTLYGVPSAFSSSPKASTASRRCAQVLDVMALIWPVGGDSGGSTAGSSTAAA